MGGASSFVVQGLLGPLGSFLAQAVTAAASWFLSGLVHALSSTTADHFNAQAFSPVWRGMGAVAVVVATGVLLVSLIASVLQGSPERIGRSLGMLALGGLGLLLARPMGQGLSVLVGFCSSLVVSVSGEAPAQAFGRLATDLSAGSALSGVPWLAVVVLGLLVLVAALVVWVELAVAHAAAGVVLVFIPIGLASANWGVGERLLRRLIEVFVALLAVPFVVTVVIVAGASVLAAGSLSFSSPGSSLDTLVTGFLILALGTLSLPATLRLTHLAADALSTAGAGRQLATRGALATAGGVTQGPSGALAGALGAGAWFLAARNSTRPSPSPGGAPGNGSSPGPGGSSPNGSGGTGPGGHKLPPPRTPGPRGGPGRPGTGPGTTRGEGRG